MGIHFTIFEILTCIDTCFETCIHIWTCIHNFFGVLGVDRDLDLDFDLDLECLFAGTLKFFGLLSILGVSALS